MLDFPLPEAWCLRLHRAHIRLRYLTRTAALLRCDVCQAFR